MSGVAKRMEWLLELMGLIRNVVYGTTPVTCGDTKLVCSSVLLLKHPVILTSL